MASTAQEITREKKVDGGRDSMSVFGKMKLMFAISFSRTTRLMKVMHRFSLTLQSEQQLAGYDAERWCI